METDKQRRKDELELCSNINLGTTLAQAHQKFKDRVGQKKKETICFLLPKTIY